jgi:hypothetical protein
VFKGNFLRTPARSLITLRKDVMEPCSQRRKLTLKALQTWQAFLAGRQIKVLDACDGVVFAAKTFALLICVQPIFRYSLQTVLI